MKELTIAQIYEDEHVADEQIEAAWSATGVVVLDSPVKWSKFIDIKQLKVDSNGRPGR